MRLLSYGRGTYASQGFGQCVPYSIQYRKGSYKEYHHAEQIFQFDFTKQNFIFATTELDKLFAPFKDRLTIVDFKPYTVKELAEITDLVCGEIEFDEGLPRHCRNHKGQRKVSS